MKRVMRGLLWLLLAGASVAGAAPMGETEVPELLRPWIPWVLHGQDEARCPFAYSDANRRHCAWPSRLTLDLGTTRGTFQQEWLSLTEGWVSLPGDARYWPQAVSVDGRPATVMERGGVPQVHLPPGRHELRGAFEWQAPPDSLKTPADTGLISLRVDGKDVPFPNLDQDGRLWLRGRSVQPKEAGDSLEVRVFRRVEDDVPLQVLTRIQLQVAGSRREVLLGRALLEGAVPMALEAPLPTRLEADGRLRVQVRPGSWVLELRMRFPGPVQALKLDPSPGPWDSQEVWVFEAYNHLRLVKVEGVNPMDPRQTALPDDWRNLPAYRLQPGDTMRLVELRRGDPDPEPDRLSLNRSLWLDFDGGGFTVQDRITGTMTRGWRLAAGAPLELGRVTVDGQGQFITRLAEDGPAGVEVRRGKLDLEAHSRIPRGNRLPVAGWGHDFQSVGGRLYLPPGWRLLGASGVDRVARSWLSQWSLFDLFLVLIIAAAVHRLWGWSWGLLALAAVGLAYHEPGAPVQVWLHILAAVALLRVLPAGRFRWLVGWYRNLAFAALLIIAVPFAVQQVRAGLFPVLERPWQAVGAGQPPAAPAPVAGVQRKSAPVPRLKTQGAGMMDQMLLAEPSPQGTAQGRQLASSLAGKSILRYDPDAAIQTGPGLPAWRWREVQLTWSGPVADGEQLGLWLVPPWLNGLLRGLSVVLMALLALRLPDRWPGRIQGGGRLAGVLAVAVILGPMLALPEPARAEMPSQEMLETLRKRLLEPADCLPGCAQMPAMDLEADARALRLHLWLHAGTGVAVPLPGQREHWSPERVLVDGEPASGLVRDPSGRLWLQLEEGRHEVLLDGALPAREKVQLDLPLKPHRVTSRVAGWRLEGLHENGLADAQLQLTRMDEAKEGGLSVLTPANLPPYVRLQRTLRLGLEWRVENRVTRVSPTGNAVVMELPLLPGESVTSAEVRVRDGRVQVNMAPGQVRFTWRSVLARAPSIILKAPEESGWSEVWRLDASPIWHVRTEGIPVAQHTQSDRWLPQWRPWPGEVVNIAVTRPTGVPGRTLTIQSSHLKVRPGERTRESVAEFTVQSSRGGQHAVSLPDGARLQSVSIDGRPQPVRPRGRVLTLPVTPGTQTVRLVWREDQGLGSRFVTPVLDLSEESVNATVEVEMPRQRWVLFTGGPRLGPAVLFWGLLLVILAVALALGRTGRTPLSIRHWLLLGVGLSQVPVWASLLVLGWLFGVDQRGRMDPEVGKWRFNLVQVGVFLLTLVALGVLFNAVHQGLLGTPDMQIGGNGSSGYLLRWYADRSAAELPGAWVISIPILVYRLLMLAWALWLAFALIGWLRWGWDCFSSGGIWRTIRLARPRSPSGKPPPPAKGPDAG